MQTKAPHACHRTSNKGRTGGTAHRFIPDGQEVLVETPVGARGEILRRRRLKNAIDWASRPYGTNSLTRKPSAVIGASPGKIGTALAQQNVRSALSFCNSPQMGAPEAYIQFTPGLITDDGEVTDKATE